MTVSKTAVYTAAVWLVLLTYLALVDRDAFLLSVVLTPILGALVGLAFRSKQLVATIFMFFALLSHAIAPPFFFMRREFYSYGGTFGAVKDFHFGVVEFLRIYVWVLLFLGGTLLWTLALSRVLPARKRAHDESSGIADGLTDEARVRVERWLIGFLVAVALPVSLIMYSARIGITGLEPPVLPFRMTGILTYFRMFVVPIAIFVGYVFSRRTRSLTAVVLIYGFIGGFAAASRYIVLTTAVPVALFPLINRQWRRFAAVGLATAITFVLVTASRDYVYTRNLSLPRLITTTVTNYQVSTFSPFEIVGGISNRLYGPQDVVLAYQYRLNDRLDAIEKYFSNRIVVENILYEFYGVVLSTDSVALGVGIGYIPWMILLADRSVTALLALALVTAFILTLSQRVVDAYAAAPLRAARALEQPLAFFLVYSLYSSSLNWWTDAIVLALVGLVSMRLYRIAFAAAAPPDAAVPIG